MKTFLLKPLGRKWKWSLFLAMVALEAMLATYIWTTTRARPNSGMLVRAGREYLVAWRSENHQLEVSSHRELSDALRFAREELLLEETNVSNDNTALEHLWLRDRQGAYVLLWKTFSFSFLNQLTFDRKDDAMYFAEAFRRGAYSPSPFGHSVMMRPIANQ